MAKKKSEKPVVPVPDSRDWTDWAAKKAGLLAILLVLIATLRIAGTYWVFNHTIDEPAHIACGMEWLSKGTYGLEAQHPPLARVMTAIGPYLDGARSAGRDGIYNEGAAILYTDNHYDTRLALARAGVLPFFWLACFVIFHWGSRCSNSLGGLLTLLVFTNTPTVLAHAGLATTDMALTAGLAATLFQFLIWIDQPSWRNTILLGASAAIAVLSKLTALPFFPACVGAALLFYVIRAKPPAAIFAAKAKMLALPALVSLLLFSAFVWAGFRFSFNGVPAPEFFEGLKQVLNHNASGHPSYLLGTFSDSGFWYYYPAALFFKTPVPILILAVLGFAWRGSSAVWIPAAFAAGLLFFTAFSRINIGTRHVLPIFVFMALLAGYASMKMLTGHVKWMRIANAALLAWIAISTAASHPDYLPYFNFFAGDKPQDILVDSDLDWGQDMKRLGAKLQDVGASYVSFNPFIVAHLERVHGFPRILESDPENPTPGWNAVSLTVLKLDRLGLGREHPEIIPWPDRLKPNATVGKGVLLYFIPGGK
jgi:hypothetical protein